MGIYTEADGQSFLALFVNGCSRRDPGLPVVSVDVDMASCTGK